jgi:hypothetical protein
MFIITVQSVTIHVKISLNSSYPRLVSTFTMLSLAKAFLVIPWKLYQNYTLNILNICGCFHITSYIQNHIIHYKQLTLNFHYANE